MYIYVGRCKAVYLIARVVHELCELGNTATNTLFTKLSEVLSQLQLILKVANFQWSADECSLCFCSGDCFVGFVLHNYIPSYCPCLRLGRCQLHIANTRAMLL